MSRVHYAFRALRDLREIWTYVSEDSEAAADGLIERLLDKCRLLAASPGLGRLRPELGEHARSLPVGQYVIIYRPMRDGIRVSRFLHGMRDIPAQFRGR